MAFDRLRRYEVQAVYALWLSLVSLVPCLVALWLAGTRYDAQLARIIYGSRGSFLAAFVACALASMAPAGLGFVLGWNSAGQRRNDRPTYSWIGFFLGGSVLTINLVLLIAFYMLRLERPT